MDMDMDQLMDMDSARQTARGITALGGEGDAAVAAGDCGEADATVGKLMRLWGSCCDSARQAARGTTALGGEAATTVAYGQSESAEGGAEGSADGV